MKKLIRIITIALILSTLGIAFVTAPASAIALPSGTPSLEAVYIWRNALETGDMVVIIYENTPYAATPTTPYKDAFIWHFIDDDGVTEIAQALTFDFNEKGYGYNGVGFYFSAADAVTWGLNYYLKLTGTPAAFTSPPEYTYSIISDYYSTLTDTIEVKIDIAEKIFLIANDLNNQWGLTASYYLTSETPTGTVLSLYGESFFRGALYGVQGYAPAAFELNINNLTDLTDRPWTDNYSLNLLVMYGGTYIGTSIDAGNAFLGVNYNLMGMLLTLLLITLVIIGGIMLSGDWWSAAINGVPPLVIMTRMGMWGLGELGLIAAVGWLFVSAKVWKII